MNMLRKSGPPLTEQTLVEVQQQLPFSLPPEVAAFYLETNGGYPVNDSWSQDTDDKTGGYWIQRFLPLGDPSSDMSIEKTYAKGIARDYLDRNLVPFAIDHSENYFCFDQQGGVHYYAMDEWSSNLSPEENKREADTSLTPSFNKFLNELVPYRESLSGTPGFSAKSNKEQLHP